MSDYSDLYNNAAQQYGEDPLWVQAMAQQESNQNPNAVSSKGATGIMQLMPGTAEDLGVKDATDPAQNIPAGVKYYHNQRAAFKDPTHALVAYNWGPENAKKWIANGADPKDLPEETQDYVANVHRNYQNLQAQNSTVGQQIPLSSVSQTEEVDPIKAAFSRAKEKDTTVTPAADPIKQAFAKAAGEQTTNDDKSKIGVAEDIAKSTPGAIARGVGGIFTWPAAAGNLVAQLGGQAYGTVHDWASDKAYTPEQHAKLNSVEPFYSGATLGDVVTKVGAGLTEGIGGNSLNPEQHARLQKLEQNGLIEDQLHNPETTPGKIYTGAIEGALGAPGAIGTGLAKSAATGAVAAAANDAYPNNPFVTALAGAAIPASVKGFHSLGGSISPEMAQLAQSAKNDFGINIPPGHLTENPVTSRAYSLLNRLGFAPNATASEFTRAVGNQFGIDTDKLTNPVMADAKDNIASGYSKVADIAQQKGGIRISDRTLNSLQDLKNNAVEGAEPVDKFLDKLTTAVDENGNLSVGAYKKLTQKGSYIDNLRKSTKPELRDLGRQMESLINDDLGDSAGPEAKNLLQETDRKYALWNMANETRDDTSGQISPAQFSSQAWKQNANYFRTSQNLRNPSNTYKLANIADQLKLGPSSGTTENWLTAKLAGLAGAGAIGGATGGVIPAAAAIGGSYGALRGLGAALNSNTYRNYLINKSLGNDNPSTFNKLMNYTAPNPMYKP